MYHKIIKGQYWVFGSKTKFEQGFMPRFKCSSREELKAFYRGFGLVLAEV
jgi:hypothetical protein